MGEQVPERAAHEHLDASATWEHFQLSQLFDVGGRAADVEGVVAPGPAPGHVQLGLEVFGIQGQGLGVWHFEDARDTAEHGSPCTGLEVFLVGQPGFPEMDLAVDHTRQHVQSGDLQVGVGAPAAAQRPQCHNAACPAGDVDHLFAVGGQHPAARDQQVGVPMGCSSGWCGRGDAVVGRHGQILLSLVTGVWLRLRIRSGWTYSPVPVRCWFEPRLRKSRWHRGKPGAARRGRYLGRCGGWTGHRSPEAGDNRRQRRCSERRSHRRRCS